jgi:hypothetical protein
MRIDRANLEIEIWQLFTPSYLMNQDSPVQELESARSSFKVTVHFWRKKNLPE